MKKKYSTLEMILYPVLYIGFIIFVLKFFLFPNFTFQLKSNLGSQKISVAIYEKNFNQLNRLDLNGYSFTPASELITFNSTSYDESNNYLSYNDIILSGVIHPESCIISNINEEKHFSFCFEVSKIEAIKDVGNPQVLWSVSAYDITTGSRIETHMEEQGSIDSVSIKTSDVDKLENIILVFSAVPLTDNGNQNFAGYISDVTNSNSNLSLVRLSDLL